MQRNVRGLIVGGTEVPPCRSENVIVDRRSASGHRRSAVDRRIVFRRLHDLLERRVYDTLDVGAGAETRLQRDLNSAGFFQQLVHISIHRHVGAAESVDRLFRIADDEELAANRLRVLPFGNRWIGGRQQHEDLGLQRIGVLKLVDKDALEALLKARSHDRVVSDQISRLHEQIEEIERAGSALGRLVRVDAASKLLVKQPREIGVGILLEARKRLHQLFARLPHVFAQHALPVKLAAALPALLEIAVADELDERSLDTVVVAGDDGFRAAQVFDQLAGRPAVCIKVVVRARRIREQLDERPQLKNSRVDARAPVERCMRPLAREIAPLNQVPAGSLQSIDRSLICFGRHRAETAERWTPQRAPHAFGRIGELLLHPAVKRFVVQPLRLALGEHGEERIDAGFDRALAKQIRAKTMDSTDLRLF